jgi:DNA invertase Pin-like site-specific DNA recombinase
VRVGLYARVSTERQQERGTVASQLEALRAAAEAAGDEIVEEFVERASDFLCKRLLLAD